MHMRKKKWSRPELAACPYFITDPVSLRGHWAERFPVKQPLHVELGCGKGVSTAQMVYDNQDVNFLAMDINVDVLGVARRNIAKAYGEQEPHNILLTNAHIEYIHTILCADDPVERIYISFCNPWDARPKQHKRRLTHPRQLAQYRHFLVDGGEIWFKTDDDQLFSDSLHYFEAFGFECLFKTDDLHGCGFTPNYISEYERKYLNEGLKIHFGIFKKLPGKLDFDPVAWRIWDGEISAEERMQTTAKERLYIVKRIVEDDYGCEGVPEDQEKMVTLLLADQEGKLRRHRMPDAEAYELELQEGTPIRLSDTGDIEPADIELADLFD